MGTEEGQGQGGRAVPRGKGLRTAGEPGPPWVMGTVPHCFAVVSTDVVLPRGLRLIRGRNAVKQSQPS